MKDELIELSRELVKAMKSMIQKDQLLSDLERRVEEFKKKHNIEEEEERY